MPHRLSIAMSQSETKRSFTVRVTSSALSGTSRVITMLEVSDPGWIASITTSCIDSICINVTSAFQSCAMDQLSPLSARCGVAGSSSL